jgi:two-component system, NarL family, sensor kinase
MESTAGQAGIHQVYLIIGVAMASILLLGGAIILFVLYYQKRMVQEKFQRQVMEIDFHKKMMEASLESQENERRRVAADLHDSIGAMLSTIRLSFLTFARENKTDNNSIQESKKMIDDTIDSVRRISRDLMPSTLEKFGLSQAVKEMCERFQNTSSISIIFDEEGTYQSLSKKKELMIFRIIQELINNALKHSGASRIKVTLNHSHNLTVVVEDNGKGFDVQHHLQDRTTGKGLGLFNIENRARVIGAEIFFESQQEKGSNTTITVPYEKI